MKGRHARLFVPKKALSRHECIILTYLSLSMRDFSTDHLPSLPSITQHSHHTLQLAGKDHGFILFTVTFLLFILLPTITTIVTANMGPTNPLSSSRKMSSRKRKVRSQTLTVTQSNVSNTSSRTMSRFKRGGAKILRLMSKEGKARHPSLSARSFYAPANGFVSPRSLR